MKQRQLKINRPSLTATWTAEQMDNAKVRIHQRFQGLITSIIESADWGNFKLTPNPVEVGRPAFPEPGAYCDLYLSRRQSIGMDNKVIAAMEIKTRSVSLTDRRSTWQIAEQVLEKMSPNLTKLQEHAKGGGVLWVVCVGLYHSPFQMMAKEFTSDFEVVMYWGRDVGQGQPMGRARWSSLSALDKAMCDFIEPSEFWSLASSHKPSPPPPPPALNPIAAATLFGSTQSPPSSPAHQEAVNMIMDMTKGSLSTRAALMSVLNWPEEPARLADGVKDQCELLSVTDGAVRHRLLEFIDLGIISRQRFGRRWRYKMNIEKLKEHYTSKKVKS